MEKEMKRETKLIITVGVIGLIIFLFNYRNSFIFKNPLNLNGENCARVEYYNSNTGIQSTYTLKVYVEDRRVTDIFWNNGGELNEKHFKEYAYIHDGVAYATDDRGRDFIIELIDDEECD